MDPEAVATVRIIQNDNGEETPLVELKHPLTQAAGIEQIQWRPQADITAEHRFLDDKEVLPLPPVAIRFEVEINGIVNSNSTLLHLEKPVKLNLEDDSTKSARVTCYDATGRLYETQMRYGRADFGTILLGPLYVEIESGIKETTL
jgi:hypothetical protein